MKRAQKTKVGRPPRHKEGRLSKNRTFRVRGGLDERLVAHAHASGRSVSEEIEARLQRSLYFDEALTTIAGPSSPLIYALSAAVGLATLTEDEKNRSYVLEVAAVHIIAALSGLAPNALSERVPPEWLVSTRHGLHGLNIAGVVLRSIGAPESIRRFNKTADSLQAEMIARARGKPVDEALLKEIRLDREEAQQSKFKFVEEKETPK